MDRREFANLLISLKISSENTSLIMEILPELSKGVDFSESSSHHADGEQVATIEEAFLAGLHSTFQFFNITSKTVKSPFIAAYPRLFFGEMILSRLALYVDDEKITIIQDAVESLLATEIHPVLPDSKDGDIELFVTELVNDYKNFFAAIVLAYLGGNETFKIVLDLNMIILSCRFFWVLGFDDEDNVYYFTRN